MIAVVQRVAEASVATDDPPRRRAIAAGLCVLLAVEPEDAEVEATWMAGKIARLRIFRDDAGLMNRSVADVGGAILLVSQFTLVGDCRRGNRPSFVGAAPPEHASALCDRVAAILAGPHALPVETGVFGADMKVALVNDGPVTLILRTPGPIGDDRAARG